MRNWAALIFGLLSALLLALSVSGLVLLRTNQDNLRQQSYDVTGMAALQLRLHYELLMEKLALLELSHTPAASNDAVVAFDVLYERVGALPTRPGYAQILDAELLGIQSGLAKALKDEIPVIDRAADGDPAALDGMRTRLEALRGGFDTIGHKPVQIASEIRANITREYERIADWFLVIISGFILSGISFVAIITRQLMKLSDMAKTLRSARDSAEAASKAKSDFLSHMSHELRTPMNAILGFAQLLEMGQLTDRQAIAVKQILGSGELLLGLIDQVLELNRIIAGNLDVKTQTISPYELLTACRNLVVNKAREHNVVLHEPVIGDGITNIVTDPMRIQQILLNLLTNAIKYNKPGGDVFLSCAMSGPDRIEFCVRDTGQGIPAERQHQLFEPFNRLGRESGTVQGTGIGMTITKELLTLLHGTIRFESRPGEGSTFWVAIPVTPATESAKPLPQLESKSVPL